MPDFPGKIIGIYYVDENPDVSLVELVIDKKVEEIDIGEFTQEVESQPQLSWQAPFAEKYLSSDGETIIGDDFHMPDSKAESTRFTFYIYFLDPAKPLLTPFGPIQLPPRQDPPKRISNQIVFEYPE